MDWIVTAVLLAAGGSLHCMGMCGGFAMLTHAGGRGMWHFVAYGAGKTLTYVALGVLAGLIGQATTVSPAASRALSMVAGGVMIVSGLQLGGWVALERLYVIPATRRLVGALSSRVQKSSVFARFAMGALNGLLPCGLLYAALGAAAATFVWWKGAAFMAIFGLSTLPALLLAAQLGRLLDATQRRVLVRVGAVMVIVFGVVMLLRGTELMHRFM